MICKHCGAHAAEGARFCEYCGERLDFESERPLGEDSGLDAAQNAGGEESGFVAVHPAAGAYVEEQSAAQRDMPMKWHKFLVYFALWLSAFSNLSNGFSVLNGGHYEGGVEMVYSQISALKPLDMVSGITMIALGVFGFYTAYSLLTMKKGAPKLLLILYGISAVLNLGYSIAGALIIKSAMRLTDVSSILTSGIGNAVFSGIMIVITMIYYKKREHLFVN